MRLVCLVMVVHGCHPFHGDCYVKFVDVECCYCCYCCWMVVLGGVVGQMVRGRAVGQMDRASLL